MTELALRMVASLAVVVGLLILTARLAGRKFRGSSDSLVTVLHRQALSRTSAVSVVSVGTRLLVLGTTEQQVRVLAELDPTDLGETSASAPVAAPARVADVAPVAAVAAADETTAPDPPDLAPVTAHTAESPTTRADGDTSPAEYADFAAALLSQFSAQKTSAQKTSAQKTSATNTAALSASALTRSAATPTGAPLGRHRSPAPGVETPPVLPGGRRVAVRPAPVAAPAPTPARIGTDLPVPASGPVVSLVPPPPASDAATALATGAATAAARAAGAGSSALAGSVLSPQTWRQALAALSRRAS